MPCEFLELTPADVPAAFGLSRHVGWNQSEADWLRLLELEGNNAVGVRLGGELVATSTLMRYGDELAWIGMVIVHESQRGRGLGKAVLSRALEFAQQRPVSGVGLDATEQGRPLYERAGFAEVQAIERWAGTLVLPNEHAPRQSDGDAPIYGRAGLIDPSTTAELAAFDLQATGVDRSLLLRRLLVEEGNSVWFTHDGSAVTGYAILRPGRVYWQLGPLVSAGSRETATLLNAAVGKLDGDRVLVDLLDGETADLLQRAGLQVQRRLLRMTLGGRRPDLAAARVRLAAGLELG